MANNEWYKNAVVYQIYPKSFRDADGNGIGDLRGIIDGLDYLEQLGVNAIWISPCYKSPDFDCGYDISDYRAISEQYGTMDDFCELLDNLHRRGMKLLMDFVVNHTSYEHPWFVEARKSRDNPYHDYYIWRNREDIASDDATGEFGGGVWEYAPECDQYYLHLFTPEQPDLNWDNPIVRREIADMANFWLDMGVDGFRCDVIYLISKDDEMKSFGEGPHLHEYLRELNDRAFEPHGAMTVAEVWGFSPEDTLRLIGYDRHELTMAFQFDHMCLGRTGRFDPAPFDAEEFVEILCRWQTELDGRAPNALVLENHDQPRIVSRYGNDKIYRAESAKTLAALTFCMKGTPYIYQGQELGLINPRFNDSHSFADVETINFIDRRNSEFSSDELLSRANFGTRDAGRVPFPWNSDRDSHFGFCPPDVKPWLWADMDYESTNADCEVSDDNSVFNFYRRLIDIKKNSPLFIEGAFTLLYNKNGLFAYKRELNGQAALIFGVFGDKSCSYTLPQEARNGKILLSTYPDTQIKPDMELRPWETVVLLF